MLNDFNKKISEKKCCGPNDRKPDIIPNFSPKKIPAKIPISSKSSSSEEWTISTGQVVEGALVAGGTALTGYVAYRVIRLLPSLLPPLWPTLVPNLLAP